MGTQLEAVMSEIKFKVNGVDCTVGSEVSSQMTLVDYIRNVLGLKGVKYMCREGGCGACIVSIKTSTNKILAVNACLVSITSCHGWAITTIEGLGNKHKGYHALQSTLAKFNGSQCGYCSPSWVMAMFSRLSNKTNLTRLEIEKSFASNVCRCTGYRPIMDAFKSFASDAPVSNKLLDIEDLHICKKSGKECDKDNKDSCDDADWCVITKDDVKDIGILTLSDGRIWARANYLDDIFEILQQEGDDSYMLVFGNTGKGVLPIDEYPRVLIDITGVQELKGYELDQNLIIGAGTTLTEMLSIFEEISKKEYFGYLQKFHAHIEKVAHIAVRNIGSLGGNLMLKHLSNSFSSDIFLLLETVGAMLTIQTSSNDTETVEMQEFLSMSMKGSIIVNAILPPLSENDYVETYKAMPRSQNAHAVVNSGCLFKLSNRDHIVLEARIVFGGLSPTFIRAEKTENFLKDKYLFSNCTLQSALKILESELVVTENVVNYSVEYRTKLALGLFYKSLLTIAPSSLIGPKYQSGAISLHDTRPVSQASQIYDTVPSLYPLTQPMTKTDALMQCAGEVRYIEDIPEFHNEVFCSFAMSTVPTGTLVSIDATEALKYPGVIAFYSAKDIPAKNSFTPSDTMLYSNEEEVFCSGIVKYFNQPIGLIVAETRHIADVAVKLVKATYENVRIPVLDIREAKNDSTRNTLYKSSTATEKGNDTVKVIKGTNSIYGQYHFSMETMTCLIRQEDDILDVYCSTQWLEGVQLMISRALGIKQNSVKVYCRRVGGSYGLKLSRPTQGAVACALAVSKLGRPCRWVQSLSTNMRAVGKRLPCASDFEVGVNSLGVIQHASYNLYEDDGYEVNETFTAIGFDLFNNVYNKSRWNFNSYDTITDTAKNTWARAPGTLEHVAMSEFMMEQIAYEMSLDPLEVRLANIDDSQYSDIKEMINTVKANANYDNRREIVNKFNNENKWKKRGLRFSLMRWAPLGVFNFEINLSVYRGDGTVTITHGAAEMGQGIDVKVIQVVAYTLGISVDKVRVDQNNTVIAPNVGLTGGSATTQGACICARRASVELLNRLKPIRDTLSEPTWEELITKAYQENVDLQTHAFLRTDEAYPSNAYGVALAEMEIDVLTGESEIRRVDLCEDVGQSLNPEVDMGQVEGAFIMGVGYWLCERLVYDKKTGELKTNRSWDYHVPQMRDIPQQWNVSFRKNSYSSDVTFGAKVIGEPPICLSVVVALAAREAITAARLDSGIPTTEWFSEDGPYTVERICMKSESKIEDFKFN